MLVGCWLALLAAPASESLREQYDKGKCKKHSMANTEYCKLLAKQDADEMGSVNGSAPKLYDAYHRLGGGGLSSEGTAQPGSVAMLRAISTLLPPKNYSRVIEGGPGNCWLLKQLASRGYAVRGQEISAFAIKKYCQSLDVRQGFLKSTSFDSGSANLMMAFDVMEHIPKLDLPLVLQEFRRLLDVKARPKPLLLINVGVCAHLCSTGFCADSRIHPIGLCAEMPRAWWDEQLHSAGFTPFSDEEMRPFEKLLLDYTPRTPAEAGEAACAGKAVVRCKTSWNPPGHQFFISSVHKDKEHKGHHNKGVFDGVSAHADA